MSRPAVGLVPAAGRGTRSGLSSPKELVVVGHRPLIAFALDALRAAEVKRAVVVDSEDKAQPLRDLLGDGSAFGVSLTWARQRRPAGLPDAVRAAGSRLAGADVAFVMPDTVFTPVDALRRLRDRARRSDAELVLGVFAVDDPRGLAPVEHDRSGRVLRVLDKPRVTALRNTWGVLWWGPRFTDRCARWPRRSAEPTLTEVINAVVADGGRVVAEPLVGGAYCDAGTPAGLARARQMVAGISPSGPRPVPSAVIPCNKPMVGPMLA